MDLLYLIIVLPMIVMKTRLVTANLKVKRYISLTRKLFIILAQYNKIFNIKHKVFHANATRDTKATENPAHLSQK